MMEGSIRRRAPDEAKIRSRNSKLLEREITRAVNEQQIRIQCPCRLHMKGSRSSLLIRSYQRCLTTNGRHPWFYGSSEGYDADDSDLEWDDHIRWYHGERLYEEIKTS
ncbi:hypothetical protein M758_UG247200 [Ceratodon purpureus]|nr:hypothetical protein M758_UG247200 [Ceratodon purpureus]